MDAYDLMSQIHDRMDLVYRSSDDHRDDMPLDHEDGFKTWPELDQAEVERVGRSLAALFGITLD